MYHHAKNQLISSFHSWDTADFRVPRPKRSCPLLTPTIQNYNTPKISYLVIPSWATASFSDLRSKWTCPFLTKQTQIFFNELLISMNLYQHAKKQACSSFCFRDTTDLKILHSDWPRTFSKTRFGICVTMQQIIQTFFIDQI